MQGVSDGHRNGSVVASVYRWVVGRPLRAHEVTSEQITPVQGIVARVPFRIPTGEEDGAAAVDSAPIDAPAATEPDFKV